MNLHKRHFIIGLEEFLDKYNHIRQPVPERKKKKKKKQNLIEISDEEYERVRPGPLLAMVSMPLEDISALIHGTYKNPSFHMANSTSFFNQCIYTDTKRKSFDVNSCFDYQTIIDREISKTESKKLEEELIQRKAQNKQNSGDNWDFYSLIENPKLTKLAANNFFEVDDYLNQKNQMTNSKDKNGVPNLGQGDAFDYDPAAMDAPFQADDLSDIKPNQMNTTFNNKNNKGNMNLQKIDDKFSADKNGNDGFSTPKLDRVHHRGLNSKPSDQEVAPSNNAPNSQLSFLDTIKKYLPKKNKKENGSILTASKAESVRIRPKITVKAVKRHMKKTKITKVEYKVKKITYYDDIYKGLEVVMQPLLVQIKLEIFKKSLDESEVHFGDGLKVTDPIFLLDLPAKAVEGLNNSTSPDNYEKLRNDLYNSFNLAAANSFNMNCVFDTDELVNVTQNGIIFPKCLGIDFGNKDSDSEKKDEDPKNDEDVNMASNLDNMQFDNNDFPDSNGVPCQNPQDGSASQSEDKKDGDKAEDEDINSKMRHLIKDKFDNMEKGEEFKLKDVKEEFIQKNPEAKKINKNELLATSFFNMLCVAQYDHCNIKQKKLGEDGFILEDNNQK